MGLGWVPSRAEQHPQALRPEQEAAQPSHAGGFPGRGHSSPSFYSIFFFLEIPDLTRAAEGLQHQEDLLPEHGEVRSPAGSPAPHPSAPLSPPCPAARRGDH